MENFKITHAYTVLHFDDYPILFIGINGQNQIVVGSFICEDDNENLLFFYLIVPDEIAINFLKRNISYLEVMAQASEIYIVTNDYNDNVIGSQKIEFQEIDSSTLPLPSAYCPIQDKRVIRTFEINSIFLSAHKYLVRNLAQRKTRPAFGYLEEVGRIWYNSSRISPSYPVENYKQAHEYKSNQTQSFHSFKTSTKELHNHV